MQAVWFGADSVHVAPTVEIADPGPILVVPARVGSLCAQCTPLWGDDDLVPLPAVLSASVVPPADPHRAAQCRAAAARPQGGSDPRPARAPRPAGRLCRALRQPGGLGIGLERLQQVCGAARQVPRAAQRWRGHRGQHAVLSRAVFPLDRTDDGAGA